MRHIATLQAAGTPLLGKTNPDVVQLHGCGPREMAYETPTGDGRRAGAFSTALAGALEEAATLQITWTALIDHVRRLIRTTGLPQRPTVTGPAQRLIFSTVEAEQEASLPIVTQGPNRARILGAALLGVHVGDEFAVMPAGAAGPEDATRIGDAIVDEVVATEARARLDLRLSATTVPIGARAHRTKAAAPLSPVKLPQSNPDLDELVAAVTASPLLRPAGTDESFDYEARIDHAGDVTIHDRIGPLSDPFPATVTMTIVTNLERLARAAALRRLADDTRPPHEDQVTVEWGTVIDGRPVPMQLAGSTVRAGQQIYIRIRNDGKDQVYVSLIDIGVAATVTVLTASDPTGLRLDPGREYLLGESSQDDISGVEISWPRNLDPSHARIETIMIVTTSEPLDVGVLRQSGVREVTSLGRSPLEQRLAQAVTGSPRYTLNASEAAVRYAIRSIEFKLDPRPAPIEDEHSIGIADLALRIRKQTAISHGKMRLPVINLPRSVPYEQLYVEPVLTLEKTMLATDLAEFTRPGQHIVILGEPGSGKSTMLQKLAHDLATDGLPGAKRTVPFLLALREFRKLDTGDLDILEALKQLCRQHHNIDAPRPVLKHLLLSETPCVLLIDGLDELIEVATRRRFTQLLEGFAQLYPQVSTVVTSRVVGYADAPLDPRTFTRATIGRWNVNQVRHYVERWFELDDPSAPYLNRLATSFMTESETIADLRASPLLLGLLCSLYATEHFIPANRVDILERCSQMLLERWDTMRGIGSPPQPRAWIEGALGYLAWQLLNTDRPYDAAPRHQINGMLLDYLTSQRIDRDEAARVAEELLAFVRGRAWALTEVGTDADEPIYGFTHRTFLEYFAARHLARRNPAGEQLWPVLRPYILSGRLENVAHMAWQQLERLSEDADKLLRLAMADHPSNPQQRSHLKDFVRRVASENTVSRDVGAQIERFLQGHG